MEERRQSRRVSKLDPEEPSVPLASTSKEMRQLLTKGGRGGKVDHRDRGSLMWKYFPKYNRNEIMSTVSETRDDINKFLAFDTGNQDNEKNHTSTYRLMHLDQIDALLNTSCESCNRNKEEKTVRHTTIKNYTYGMATGLCVQCKDCKKEI